MEEFAGPRLQRGQGKDVACGRELGGGQANCQREDQVRGDTG